MKKIIRDTLILTAITLISGLALATVYQITKQPIAQAEAAAELAAYEGVFPEAMKIVPGHMTVSKKHMVLPIVQ